MFAASPLLPLHAMDWLATPEAWIALGSLTALEIVLGIDNIVFISILSNNLPEAQRPKARLIGLAVALIGRIVLLLSIAWIMQLTQPLFALLGHVFSGRDLILMAGGLFLIGKSTYEIHDKLEGPPPEQSHSAAGTTFLSVIAQIFVIDIVFSLDSVITAIGMADDVEIMITAIVVAIGIMMLSANAVSNFIDDHPTVKMLALSFLLLIGVMLVAESLGEHIPKGYIYSAMGFALFVETLNLRVRGTRKTASVDLHGPYGKQPDEAGG